MNASHVNEDGKDVEKCCKGHDPLSDDEVEEADLKKS